MSDEAPFVEEMLAAGEMAYDECVADGCTKREIVTAVYAAMQTMRELQEQRANGALIN